MAVDVVGMDTELSVSSESPLLLAISHCQEQFFIESIFSCMNVKQISSDHKNEIKYPPKLKTLTQK